LVEINDSAAPAISMPRANEETGGFIDFNFISILRIGVDFIDVRWLLKSENKFHRCFLLKGRIRQA